MRSKGNTIFLIHQIFLQVNEKIFGSGVVVLRKALIINELR
jgi:hypothetical protein